MKKVYIIGIGGIGISAIARYYAFCGYQVYGSDKEQTPLIDQLHSEGMDICIGERSEFLDDSFEIILYTEAVPKTQRELTKALTLGVPILTYPQALALIANEKQLIAVAGSHGKSTTSSLIALMLEASPLKTSGVIGSLLTEFGGKNCHFSDSKYFTIEACEYHRSFLAYAPTIGVIVNIDLDHLDYFHDLNDYQSAFMSFVDRISPGGYLVLNGEDENSQILQGYRSDLHEVLVFEEYFTVDSQKHPFPTLSLQVPGSHILFDAKIAYAVGEILKIDPTLRKESLSNYQGIWRRSEQVGTTQHGNLLMSDYGHHPTEIRLTLAGLKQKYADKKLLVVFQPHQYNRTIELLEGFKESFLDADFLIIPNIYESRDSAEDKAKMNGALFTSLLNHPDKYYGNGMENTLQMILNFDTKHPNGLIILLLGAGNVDSLRTQIPLRNCVIIDLTI